jgi:hypothetical protein
MSSKYVCGLMLFLLLAGTSSNAGAATVYDEATSGDLSNSGLSPTSITVANGSNQIFGTTGRGAAGTDRDYFTFNVSAGYDFTGLTVLPGTTSGGLSFIGLQIGNQLTLPTNTTDAVGLLGWWLYGPADINTDLLPEMAVSAMGSSGFSVPLPAGPYSVWVQDFNRGTFNYGFDVTVAPAVPEPGTYGLALAAIALAASLALRRKKQRNSLGG